MAPMPKVTTSSDLYQPSAPADVASALATLTGERSTGEDRRAILSRALTDPERVVLRKHISDLEPYVTRGTRAQKGDAILTMLIGLGGQTLSREQAEEMTVHYVQVCGDLPVWSVRRACHRFSIGDVKPEEVGAKEINLAFRPSTAQLYRVASNLATPILQRRYQMGEVLRGTAALTGPRMSEEERERVQESLKNLTAKMRADIVDDDARTKQTHLDVVARANSHALAAEYGGLAPVMASPDMPISLSLALKLGWRIEQNGRGEKILVAPGRDAP